MAQRLILRSPLKIVAATNAFRISGRIAGHPNRAHLLLSRPFATSVGTGDYLSRKHSDQKDFVHGEPSGPKILTGTIPGPKTKAGLQNLDSLQDTRAATMMTGNKKRSLNEE
jgi:4-aminobutyrate aminotransferase/(S)-3-amino-2-methylpropionate transaminase